MRKSLLNFQHFGQGKTEFVREELVESHGVLFCQKSNSFGLFTKEEYNVQ